MEQRIALLPGDGVGPEVVGAARQVLQAVSKRSGQGLAFEEGLIGGCAMEVTGSPLPDESLKLAKECRAVLLGAVGGPQWSDPRAPVRPEQGLLALRKELGLFANLRPVTVWDELAGASTLRPETVRGVDLVIVRELTGGLYFGKPSEQRGAAPNREAIDTLVYSEAEIARVLLVGFELAVVRGKTGSRPGGPRLHSVDKANVLATSRLWRQVAHEVGAGYPGVALEDMLVDTCAMMLVRRPTDFDVIVTENTFGDILSDEASMLAGSMGMLPSASVAGLGAGGHGGVYEPIHGSAPDIAGRGIANPIAAILSAAMMLELALGMPAEAAAVRGAVGRALAAGYRTADIMQPGMRQVGTAEMTEVIIANL